MEHGFIKVFKILLKNFLRWGTVSNTRIIASGAYGNILTLNSVTDQNYKLESVL